MKIVVDESSAGKRLDVFVAENSEGRFSRSSIAKLMVLGNIKLNGEVVKSKSFKLSEGDEVELDYEEPKVDEDLKVLFESDDEVVIFKPAGMLSHAKGPISGEVSVADWLRDKTFGLDDSDPSSSSGTSRRSGIVHRLDRATSGVMILARNPKSKSWLMKQFSDRNVHKKYLAVIDGVPDSTLTPALSLQGRGSFVIDMPIGRNPKKLTTFYVTDSGRPAQTEVEVLDTNGKQSLVLLTPKTGRTHQLRVHCWANGWPILGDPFYNEKFRDGEELMLHALSLTIQTSNREWQEFEAEPPEYFLAKLKELGLKLPKPEKSGSLTARETSRSRI